MKPPDVVNHQHTEDQTFPQITFHKVTFHCCFVLRARITANKRQQSVIAQLFKLIME